MSKRQRIIRASELGEYAYCSRAWWLRRVRGEEGDTALANARFSAGIRGHEQHGRAVRAYRRERNLLPILWLVAALLLLAWLVSSLLLARGRRPCAPTKIHLLL